jgi:ankyrin repeat protein
MGEPTRILAPLPHIQENAKVLFDIVESGNVEQLKERASQMQVALNELYDMPYYQNAVFRAVIIKNEQKALDMVQYLFKEGCQIDYVDFLKQTPLYYAAREGKCRLIKFLVDHGCEVNHMDTYGQTPLFYIAR